MIYKGNTEIDSIFKGNTEIQSVYKGTTEIWSNAKAFYLGNGTSFNVTQIYPEYSTLTIDDFFISAYVGTLLHKDYQCPDWDGSSCHGSSRHFNDYVNFVKEYNASTGVLTCSYGLSVDAYLIPKSNELIQKGRIVALGTGMSFNVSSKQDYQRCTINNFLFRTLNNANSHSSCASYNCPNDIWFRKTYDNTTGTLATRIETRRTNDYSEDVAPYYIPTNMIGGL